MKIVNEMPESGQFIVVWRYEREIFSSTCKWVEEGLCSYEGELWAEERGTNSGLTWPEREWLCGAMDSLNALKSNGITLQYIIGEK